MRIFKQGDTIMTMHTPATPLPWSNFGNGYTVHQEANVVGRKTVGDNGKTADAAYIAHAANAYPKLVEALRAYQAAARGGDWGAAIKGGDALLRELGENVWNDVINRAAHAVKRSNT